MRREQRRHERIPSGATVKLAGEPFDVMDLGVGGFSVRSHFEFEPESVFPFHLELPGGRTASGLAKARWCAPFGWKVAAGFEIVRINAFGRHRLGYHLHPSRYAWLHFLDAALQFGFALLLLLIVRDAVLADPARLQAAAETLPMVLVVGGLGLGFYTVFRRF